MLVECFSWGLPAEDLAGPGVERVSDRFDVLGGPDREVRALREVLAQQAVGILIAASLPRATWIAEVDLDAN